MFFKSIAIRNLGPETIDLSFAGPADANGIIPYEGAHPPLKDFTYLRLGSDNVNRLLTVLKSNFAGIPNNSEFFLRKSLKFIADMTNKPFSECDHFLFDSLGPVNAPAPPPVIFDIHYYYYTGTPDTGYVLMRYFTCVNKDGFYDQYLFEHKEGRWHKIKESENPSEFSIFFDHYSTQSSNTIVVDHDTVDYTMMLKDHQTSNVLYSESSYWKNLTSMVIPEMIKMIKYLDSKSEGSRRNRTSEFFLFLAKNISFLGATRSTSTNYSRFELQGLGIDEKNGKETIIVFDKYAEDDNGMDIDTLADTDISLAIKLIFCFGFGLASFLGDYAFIATNLDGYLAMNDIRKLYNLITSPVSNIKYSQSLFTLEAPATVTVLQQLNPDMKITGDKHLLVRSALGTFDDDEG